MLHSKVIVPQQRHFFFLGGGGGWGALQTLKIVFFFCIALCSVKWVSGQGVGRKGCREGREEMENGDQKGERAGRNEEMLWSNEKYLGGGGGS
jgi:hypothetical protein